MRSATGQCALEIGDARMDCCKVPRPEHDDDDDGIGWTTTITLPPRIAPTDLSNGVPMPLCGSSLSPLDSVHWRYATRGWTAARCCARSLTMTTTALVGQRVLFAEREVEREREN